MAKVNHTKLRFIAAADPKIVTAAVEKLPFKIEIKGAPVLNGQIWYLWFTIQDEVTFKSLIL